MTIERGGKGKVVVITGASQGLGAALAAAFAERGECRLALLARQEDKLREVARAAEKFPGVETVVVRCDVSDPSSIAAAADAVLERIGAAEVLINNAGVFSGAAFADFSLSEFDRQIAVNLRGPFLLSQAFLPAMKRKGRGDIVNICSIAALQAHPGGTGYCAAKAGLLGLTRVMRDELRAFGIRVTAVHPGAIATPSWEGSGVPEERMMTAEDVARAVVQLTGLSERTVAEDLILRPRGGDI